MLGGGMTGFSGLDQGISGLRSVPGLPGYGIHSPESWSDTLLHARLKPGLLALMASVLSQRAEVVERDPTNSLGDPPPPGQPGQRGEATLRPFA